MSKAGENVTICIKIPLNHDDSQSLKWPPAAAGGINCGVTPPIFVTAGTDYQPVLRSPAAIPLIEMWMPRCTRSSAWPAR